MSKPIDSKEQQGGKWTLFLGTVVEDKKPFERTIKVHLQEALPFVAGEVKPIDTKGAVTSTDGYSGQVETTNNVEAKYFDGFTNRRYPPDIRKNEQVLVLNYADSDTYYWISAGRDDNLRKKERFNLSVADTPNVVDELNDDNTYFIELDTLHEKRIKISTSNSDGEKYRYLLMFDSKKNTITLCDDNNNEILIESDTPRVRLRNHDGTLLDLAQKNMTLIVPEDFLLKVGRQAVLDVPVLSLVNSRGDGCTEWNVQDINIKASKSLVLSSPCIELDGAVHAKRMVTGPIQATGYSTGDDGGAYSGVSVNTGDGSGSKPANSPNEGGGNENNRHASAWEQIYPALMAIADCFEEIGGCSQASSIRTLAAESKMNLNRGE